MQKFDVIIVLAVHLGENNSLTIGAQRRLNKAREIYETGQSSQIIVSGGGTSHLSEAQVMQQYLVEKGIPKERIFKEEESTDTIGNAVFSYHMYLAPKQWYLPVVVTSAFHMPRTKFIFNKILKEPFSPAFICADDENIEEKSFHKMVENEKWLVKKNMIDDIDVLLDSLFKRSDHPDFKTTL